MNVRAQILLLLVGLTHACVEQPRSRRWLPDAGSKSKIEATTASGLKVDVTGKSGDPIEETSTTQGYAPFEQVPLGEAPPLPCPTKRVALVDRRAGARGGLQRSTLVVFQKQTPLRGSVGKKNVLGKRFEIHRAEHLEPILKDWILVQANTGVWLHEAKTFARRARLVAPPVRALAVAPDGRAFAVSVGEGDRTALRIYRFPSLELEREVWTDAPSRLRFGSDGKRLVLASNPKDSLSVVDRKRGRVRRFALKEDVNDAVLLDNKLAAYAGDSDNIVVLNLKTRRRVFATEDLIKRTHENWYIMSGAPTFLRDQNAVAYDPKSKLLYGGGDDNLLWKYDLFGDQASFKTLLKLDGNVDEILVYDDERLLVVLDSFAVQVIREGAVVEATLGPLDDIKIFSGDVRASKTSKGSVLAALGGIAVSWQPGDDHVLLSSDYRKAAAWQQFVGKKDTLCINNRESVQRVRHRRTHDVQAEVVGTYPHAIFDVVEFSSGDRMLAATGANNELLLVPLPLGSSFGETIRTTQSSHGAFGQHPSGKKAAYLTRSGEVYELSEKTKRLRLIGKSNLTAQHPRIVWSRRSKTWVVDDGMGQRRPIQ